MAKTVATHGPRPVQPAEPTSAQVHQDSSDADTDTEESSSTSRFIDPRPRFDDDQDLYPLLENRQCDHRGDVYDDLDTTVVIARLYQGPKAPELMEYEIDDAGMIRDLDEIAYFSLTSMGRELAKEIYREAPSGEKTVPDRFAGSHIVWLIEDCLDWFQSYLLKKSPVVLRLPDRIIASLLADGLFPNPTRLYHGFQQPTMFPKWPFGDNHVFGLGCVKPITDPDTLTAVDRHYEILFDLIHWLRNLDEQRKRSGVESTPIVSIRPLKSKRKWDWTEKSLKTLGIQVIQGEQRVNLNRTFWLGVESTTYKRPHDGTATSGNGDGEGGDVGSGAEDSDNSNSDGDSNDEGDVNIKRGKFLGAEEQDPTDDKLDDFVSSYNPFPVSTPLHSPTDRRASSSGSAGPGGGGPYTGAGDSDESSDGLDPKPGGPGTNIDSGASSTSGDTPPLNEQTAKAIKSKKGSKPVTAEASKKTNVGSAEFSTAKEPSLGLTKDSAAGEAGEYPGVGALTAEPEVVDETPKVTKSLGHLNPTETGLFQGARGKYLRTIQIPALKAIATYYGYKKVANNSIDNNKECLIWRVVNARRKAKGKTLLPRPNSRWSNYRPHEMKKPQLLQAFKDHHLQSIEGLSLNEQLADAMRARGHPVPEGKRQADPNDSDEAASFNDEDDDADTEEDNGDGADDERDDHPASTKSAAKTDEKGKFSGSKVGAQKKGKGSGNDTAAPASSTDVPDTSRKRKATEEASTIVLPTDKGQGKPRHIKKPRTTK